MGNRGRVRFAKLGLIVFLALALASSVLAQPTPAPAPTPILVQPTTLKPIQDRMKTWRMPHKHPNSVWLTIAEPNPKSDETERVFKFGEDRFGSVWKGRATWRPDLSAQVDETRAQLYDQAKLAGWK